MTCHNCRKIGHIAKNCWRNRQVGNPDASSTVLSSVNRHEGAGPPTAVKRAALVSGGVGGSPEICGMREDATSSWCHCMVVKFYYIDEEDHTMSVRSSTFGGETVNSYEVDTIDVDIITDFGADAPTFP